MEKRELGLKPLLEWRPSDPSHECDSLKDKALIIETAHSQHYPLPLALANGHKGDTENRPRKKLFQGKIHLSDACLRLAGDSIGFFKSSYI